MKKYLVVVECAIEFDGKFLIIKQPEGKHAVGLLSFPGGKFDPQDEINGWDVLRCAAKREIFEEVGLTLLDPVQYVSSSYSMDNDEISIIYSTFYCKLNKTIPTVIVAPREVPEYYWMTPEEINSATNSPVWLKKYVELILEHKKLYSLNEHEIDNHR